MRRPHGRSIWSTGCPDTDHADLTLAMRTGTNPGQMFDALLGDSRVSAVRMRHDSRSARRRPR
jgi:hypothetical protein